MTPLFSCKPAVPPYPTVQPTSLAAIAPSLRQTTPGDPGSGSADLALTFPQLLHWRAPHCPTLPVTPNSARNSLTSPVTLQLSSYTLPASLCQLTPRSPPLSTNSTPLSHSTLPHSRSPSRQLLCGLSVTLRALLPNPAPALFS